MTFRKTIRYIHLWLGLASGLVIMVVSLTGAIYVFADDIQEWTGRKYLTVIPQSVPRQPASVLRDNSREAVLQETGSIQWIATERIFQRTAANRSVKYQCYDDAGDYYYSVYLDPYSGQVLHIADNNSGFWYVIVDLHYRLLLGDIGGEIVKWATVIFAIMIISGIILWWPKNRAAGRQRFRIKWNASPKRLNYDLHNVLGFYGSWAVLISVFTALLWLFTSFNDLVSLILDGHWPKEENKMLATALPAPALSVADSIEQLLWQQHPQAGEFAFYFASPNNPVYRVYVTDDIRKGYEQDELIYDAHTGKLIQSILYTNSKPSSKLNYMSSYLHYGWIFGWPSKVIVFFGCIVMTSLPITGFRIWKGRHRSRLR